MTRIISFGSGQWIDLTDRIGRWGRMSAAALITAAWLSSGASAQTLNTLVIFNGTNGADPVDSGTLIADASGNLFGTTKNGGAFAGNCPFGPTALGCGTVFKIAKTATGYASTPTILYSFCSQTAPTPCVDGATPNAGLIFDASGNLFGTTTFGGDHRLGTVFEIKIDSTSSTGYASTPTTITSFCSVGLPSGCFDGTDPLAPLIIDAGGNLFGTTSGGGTQCLGQGGCGTAFEIPVDTSSPTGYAATATAGSFSGPPPGPDGEFPFAGLFMDPSGNLFGTTSAGGDTTSCPVTVAANGAISGGCGTVFEFVKDPTAPGGFTGPVVLVAFNRADGLEPVSNLISDAAGNLFGTTLAGGSHGSGTVFEIAKTATGYASTPTVLVNFCASAGCTDGALPESGLIMDAAGNLFGTTLSGGTNNLGAVYEIRTDSTSPTGYASTPTILVSFDASDTHPIAGLIADAQGNLFGTTTGELSSGNGTVFEVTDSGFVTENICAVAPGMGNCIGETISCLAHSYGGIAHAATALSYPSVMDLQNAVAAQCRG